MDSKKHKFLSKKGAFALFFVFLSLCCSSQVINNLVNNYSAEQFTTCPTFLGQAHVAYYWYLPTGYNGSSDYYNTCALFTSSVSVPNNYGGTQTPKSGSAYFGFIVYGAHQVPWVEYREYLASGLKQQLELGKTYCVTYYASLAEISRSSIKNLGVKFSNDSILNRTPSWPAPPLVLTPDLENVNIITDTVNWTKIEAQYIANGTEKFITMGNFRTNANTFTVQIKPKLPAPLDFMSYFYIDDISVVEINPAKATLKDTLHKCVFGSVVLGTDSTWDATYSWFPTIGLSCTNCPNPVASPTVSTKYYLTKQQCSATTKDSVVVSIITPTIVADAGVNATIHCVNDSLVLGTDNNSIYTYSWTPATDLSCSNCANPVASPSLTTKYYLSKQQCGVSVSDSILVTVTSATTPANAGPDKMICPGEVVQLGSDSIPNIMYNWQNNATLSCSNCPRPMASPDSTISYILQRQECAFISYDTVKVSVDDCDPTFVVPNVFSPNGDGVNDTWGINFSSIHHIKDFSLQIYNRWGLPVFSTNPELSTPNLKWDGRTTSGVECCAGTYFYIISFTKNDEEKKIKGFFSLFK